jgi:hypothetical protein
MLASVPAASLQHFSALRYAISLATKQNILYTLRLLEIEPLASRGAAAWRATTTGADLLSTERSL